VHKEKMTIPFNIHLVKKQVEIGNWKSCEERNFAKENRSVYTGTLASMRKEYYQILRQETNVIASTNLVNTRRYRYAAH
jgi:hypothetical protein